MDESRSGWRLKIPIHLLFQRCYGSVQRCKLTFGPITPEGQHGEFAALVVLPGRCVIRGAAAAERGEHVNTYKRDHAD